MYIWFNCETAKRSEDLNCVLSLNLGEVPFPLSLGVSPHLFQEETWISRFVRSLSWSEVQSMWLMSEWTDCFLSPHSRNSCWICRERQEVACTGCFLFLGHPADPNRVGKHYWTPITWRITNFKVMVILWGNVSSHGTRVDSCDEQCIYSPQIQHDENVFEGIFFYPGKRLNLKWCSKRKKQLWANVLIRF